MSEVFKTGNGEESALPYPVSNFASIMNVIPIQLGSKKPACSWKRYQSDKYPISELKKHRGNYGLVCGAVSNNILVVDIDHEELYKKFLVDDTLTVKTPSGGAHLYYYTEEPAEKIPKFEGYPIDMQGEGSYVLIPPSEIEGKKYEIIKALPIKHIDGNGVNYIRNKLPKKEGMEKRDQRPETIEDLKKKIPLSDVVQSMGIRIEVKGKGYWQGLCPFHADSNPSFTVYDDNYYCFGCGKSGDVVTFVEEMEHVDFKDAVSWLCDHYNVPSPLLSVKREEGEGREFFDDKGIPKREEFVAGAMEKWTFKTMSDTKEILYYKDGVYVEGGEILIEKFVEDVFNSIGKTATSHIAEEVIGSIRRRTYTDRSEFNKGSMLNIKNGLLDLETFELKPHSPDYLSTSQLPVAYNKDAEKNKIEKFLSEIVAEEDVIVLKELMGLCLMNGNSEQKAFMLLGSGNNGKSTFLRLIEELLGKENVSAVSLQALSDNRFAPAQLWGKKANICADLPKNAVRYTGAFKMLTGEDAIEAEKKHRDSFEFVNTAKIIFSANELPEVNDTTPAFWRRWVVINFPNDFTGRENKSLIKEMRAQLSGALNVAIEGMEKIKKEGLTLSKGIEEVKLQWLESANNIYTFVRKVITKEAGSYASKEEVYDAYIELCDETGLTAKSKGEFTKGFAEIVKTKLVRRRTINGREFVWVDVNIKKKDDTENKMDGLENY